MVGIVLVDIVVVVCGRSSGTSKNGSSSGGGGSSNGSSGIVVVVIVPVRFVSLSLCEVSWGLKQNLREIGKPTDTGLLVLRYKIRIILPNPFHMLRIPIIGFHAFRFRLWYRG